MEQFVELNNVYVAAANHYLSPSYDGVMDDGGFVSGNDSLGDSFMTRAMLEPIMEETSDDDEQLGQECWASYERSTWSPESDTGSVIQVELIQDQDTISERDFACPAKRRRHQDMEDEIVTLRRTPKIDLEFKYRVECADTGGGTDFGRRCRTLDDHANLDVYSDSDSISYNSLSRSSSLIQFESLERQMQGTSSDSYTFGGSSPSLYQSTSHHDNDQVCRISADNGMRRYDLIESKQSARNYFNLDKLDFNATGIFLPVIPQKKTGGSLNDCHLTESESGSSDNSIYSGSRASSDSDDTTIQSNKVLLPTTLSTLENSRMRNYRSGKNSVENLSEDSGYCEFNLSKIRSKSIPTFSTDTDFIDEHDELEMHQSLENIYVRKINETNLTMNAPKINSKHHTAQSDFQMLMIMNNERKYQFGSRPKIDGSDELKNSSAPNRTDGQVLTIDDGNSGCNSRNSSRKASTQNISTSLPDLLVDHLNGYNCDNNFSNDNNVDLYPPSVPYQSTNRSSINSGKLRRSVNADDQDFSIVCSVPNDLNICATDGGYHTSGDIYGEDGKDGLSSIGDDWSTVNLIAKNNRDSVANKNFDLYDIGSSGTNTNYNTKNNSSFVSNSTSHIESTIRQQKIINASYSNLTVLDYSGRQSHNQFSFGYNSFRKMASDRNKRNSGDELSKCNFLLDEMSKNFDRNLSILNDRNENYYDSLINERNVDAAPMERKKLTPPKPPPRRMQRSFNFDQSDNISIHSSPNIFVENSDTSSIASDMTITGDPSTHKKYTFDRDPTNLVTCYAESLERCNFDIIGSSNSINSNSNLDSGYSQVVHSTPAKLIVSTPNLYEHKSDKVPDNDFLSVTTSTHTSMNTLPQNGLQDIGKKPGILSAGSRNSLGKGVKFCPVVSEISWQEQSSEDCFEERMDSDDGDDEQESDESRDHEEIHHQIINTAAPMTNQNRDGIPKVIEMERDVDMLPTVILRRSPSSSSSISSSSTLQSSSTIGANSVDVSNSVNDGVANSQVKIVKESVPVTVKNNTTNSEIVSIKLHQLGNINQQPINMETDVVRSTIIRPGSIHQHPPQVPTTSTPIILNRPMPPITELKPISITGSGGGKLTSTSVYNTNETMDVVKVPEKKSKGGGFLSRISGFRFSLRGNNKKNKLQAKLGDVDDMKTINNNKNAIKTTNKNNNGTNKTHNLIVDNNKNSDFIYIPLKRENGEHSIKSVVSVPSKSATPNDIKMELAGTNFTDIPIPNRPQSHQPSPINEHGMLTTKPPLPRQPPRVIGVCAKQSSPQRAQQQHPSSETGSGDGNRFAQNRTTKQIDSTDRFLSSERDFYNQFRSDIQTIGGGDDYHRDYKMLDTTDLSAVTVEMDDTYDDDVMDNVSDYKIGLIETNLDTHETKISGKTRSLMELGPGCQRTQSGGHHQRRTIIGGSHTVGQNGAGTGRTAVEPRRPHKSMEFLLDKENQKNVLPPENELQKLHETNPVALSEHQLRVQASLQRLNIPDWFKQYSSTANQKSTTGGAYVPGSFSKKRTADSGRWAGLNSKTTSLSSLGSHRSDRSPLLLSPSAHSHHGQTGFSRWSTTHLNSSQTSPSASTRGSFSRGPLNASMMSAGGYSVGSQQSHVRGSYRQPYLGWRSQEKLSQPRTPAERLASSLLARQSSNSSAGTKDSDDQKPCAEPIVTPEIQSSIKEVTSAIVHYVNDQTNRTSNSRSRSVSPSSRQCWLESSFVGNRPLDSPQTPVIDQSFSPRGSSGNTRINGVATPIPALTIQTSDRPSPGSATLEDVLASLLGLPSDSYRSTDIRANDPIVPNGFCLQIESNPLRRHSEGDAQKRNEQIKQSTNNSPQVPRRISLDSSESKQSQTTTPATGDAHQKCRYPKCEATATASDVKKFYKSCHNCSHMYCSRECRRAHWEKHRKACLHSRVSVLCRQVLSACKDDFDTLRHLSVLARKGFISQGRGVVRILFRSPEAAELFVKQGFQCVGEATYVRWPELMPQEMGPELYSELLRLSTEYKPDSKMLLYVAICVVSEAPGGNNAAPVKWERQLVSRCAKLKLSKHLPNELLQSSATAASAAHQEKRPCTDVLILTFNSLKRNSAKNRETILINVQTVLQRRGVLIRKHYPEVFQRLSAFVEGTTERFVPVTIHPRDAATGRPFICIIMPNASDGEAIKLPESDEGNNIQTIDCLENLRDNI